MIWRPRFDGIFQRMRRIPILLLLSVMAFSAIFFLLVGCAGGGSGGQGGQEGHTSHHHSANVKLDLHTQHNSGVSGTASFEDTPRGVLVKLDLSNLLKPDTLYLAHIHPGTCADEGETHKHGGSHGGEEEHGHQHGGTGHEHGGASHEHGGAEIEYPLSQVKSDSEGHGSSTTTLRKTTVEKLFRGEPKYANVHEAGSGNPPILACADLKKAG